MPHDVRSGMLNDTGLRSDIRAGSAPRIGRFIAEENDIGERPRTSVVDRTIGDRSQSREVDPEKSDDALMASDFKIRIRIALKFPQGWKLLRMRVRERCNTKQF